MPVEKYEFQTEAKQVLELMIHSVYSNRDIFLRELVSNASDALDKLRIESLKAADFERPDPAIRIALDKGSRTLCVTDNGIGMTRDELVAFLGTIAKSGTGEFLAALEEGASSAELIGRFGVGFYSSFMVADRVVVESRRFDSDESWRWESTGDGTFSIEPAALETNGTHVTLFLKPLAPGGEGTPSHESRDYTDPWVVRELVKKYSDFVAYPIYLKESGQSEDEKPLNSMKALWLRPESEVSEEEYNEFYNHLSRDWEKPLWRIHYRAEGTLEFRSLLYIPQRAPFDLFMPDRAQGVSLYIKRVFIMHDCRELIPEYLRFVKGVVDSEDLSLNVSREILQQNRIVAMIKQNLTRKVLDTLKNHKKESREQYETFWRQFGVVLKEGLVTDAKNRVPLLELALFPSTAGDARSLGDYTAGMPEEQREIYFITGSRLETLRHSPKLELFKARGIEVLLLADPVDEIWLSHCDEFEGKKFRPVAADDLDVEAVKKIKPADAPEETTEESGGWELPGALAKILEGKVAEVRASSRLVDSPACFVSESDAPSEQMRRMMKSMGHTLPEEKKILEINRKHPLIQKIDSLRCENSDSQALEDWAGTLYDLALIADGELPQDTGAFTKRLSNLL